jgi:hypothetical protein
MEEKECISGKFLEGLRREQLYSASKNRVYPGRNRSKKPETRRVLTYPRLLTRAFTNLAQGGQ